MPSLQSPAAAEDRAPCAEPAGHDPRMKQQQEVLSGAAAEAGHLQGWPITPCSDAVCTSEGGDIQGRDMRRACRSRSSKKQGIKPTKAVCIPCIPASLPWQQAWHLQAVFEPQNVQGRDMRRACRSRSSSRAARDLLSASITSLPPALGTPPNSALWSARIRMDENCSGYRACRPARLTSSPSSCGPGVGQHVDPCVHE